MAGDAREAPVIHGLRQGGWVPVTTTTMPSVSSSSLFSSTSSTLTDDDQGDDATSSPPGHRDLSFPSSSSTLMSSDKMHMEPAAAEGPLYELSTMLDHLPARRTGLSKFYRGKSQSFTSLAGVSCVQDLAKKTTPYIRRTKAPRCYAAALRAANHLSKKIAKKARSTNLLRSSPKPPPANQGKREVYRC